MSKEVLVKEAQGIITQIIDNSPLDYKVSEMSFILGDLNQLNELQLSALLLSLGQELNQVKEEQSTKVYSSKFYVIFGDLYEDPDYQKIEAKKKESLKAKLEEKFQRYIQDRIKVVDPKLALKEWKRRIQQHSVDIVFGLEKQIKSEKLTGKDKESAERIIAAVKKITAPVVLKEKPVSKSEESVDKKVKRSEVSEETLKLIQSVMESREDTPKDVKLQKQKDGSISLEPKSKPDLKGSDSEENKLDEKEDKK